MLRFSRILWSLGILCLVLCLSACGRQDAATEGIPEPTAMEHVSTPVPSVQAPVTPTPPPTRSGEPVAPTQVPEEEIVTSQPTSPSPLDPGLNPLVEQAKEDLAHRLSIPVDQIEVLESKAVVWPDSSLGCPQPGMRYRQVPMDGALIRLEAEGKVYEYHTGGGRDPFLCEQPLKPQKDTPPQLDLFRLTPGSPND